MTLTQSRVLQFLALISLFGLLAIAYWYFSVRAATTLQQSSQVQMNQNLVGYWSFDGDDIAGTTAYDRSGQGNTGTLTNGPTKAMGKMGQGLSFGGPASSQYVGITDPGSGSVLDFANGSTITLSAWIYPTSFNTTINDYGVVLTKGGTNGNYNTNYTLQYVDGCTTQCQFNFTYVSSGPTFHEYKSTTSPVLLNTWQHIAVTYTFGMSSSAQLYYNGVLVSGSWTIGTGNAAPLETNDPLWIGGDDYTGGESVDEEFTGSIDEVRIYNTALTAKQVYDLYNQGKETINRSQNNNGDSLNDGLAGYWPLDNGSGTTATDSSTNANNGTLTNGPTWTTGQIGGGTALDGTNDYIDVPNESTFDFGNSQSFSVSAWAYRTDNGSGDTIVSKMQSSGNNPGWTLQADGTNDWLRVYLIGTTGGCGTDCINVSTDAGSFSTGTWHHVVMTYNGSANASGVHVYIDGVEQSLTVDANTLTSSILNDSELEIGTNTSGGTLWKGSLDEVRVYNRALSADEISRLYRTTSPTNPETGLKGYWSFDGPTISGTTVRDLSGAGNNGTLTNGPTKTIGKIGQALLFNGTSNYVDITDNAVFTLNSAQKYTWALWVKPSSLVLNNAQTAWSQDANNGQFFYIEPQNFTGMTNGVEVIWHMDGSNYVDQSSYSNVLSVGSWAHVVVTYDGTLTQTQRFTIFVNGVDVTDRGNVASVGTISTFDPSNIWVGNNINYGEHFPGAIDEVRLYNRALSASEIAALYNQGKETINRSQNNNGDSLNDGLAGYWPLDNGSGTTATDSSTNANNGTLTNGPTWTTGQIGSAVDFDGSNDYITLADPASGVLDFADGTNFTLSGWFNRDTFAADHTIIAKKNDQTTNQGYVVWVDNNGSTDYLSAEISDGTDTYSAIGTTNLSATGWHHFSIVWDDATGLSIYLDGRLDGSTATSTASINSLANALAFRVGAESDGGNPFDGKLDDIRVYHRALSADEISRLYRTTSPTNPETGLKGYWSFDGPTISGTTALDLSGAGNTGTLTNGPTVKPGKIGQGMNFDGSNDVVNVAAASSINDLSTFTYSAWVYPTTNGSGASPIIFKGSGSSNIKELWVDASGGSGDGGVFGEVWAATTHAYSNTSVAGVVGHYAWSHLVMTYDNAGDRKVHLYVNGSEITYNSQIAAVGTITADNTAGLGFGATADTQFYAFPGKIDEVRIYNRVLSASEIAALYNQGR